MNIKKIFLSLLVLVCIGGTIYLAEQRYSAFQEAVEKRRLYEQRKLAWEALEQKLEQEISRFHGEAGVAIKDLQTGWEFTHNQERLFPSASLAKVPIMAACFLAARQGRLNLDAGVKLRSRDKVSGSGVLKSMRQGAVFSTEELIGLMIYNSDNTATNMLTNLLGMDYLRQCFRAFGLKQTNLARKIADFRARKRGLENFTTAADMAYLLENIYRRRLVDTEVSTACLRLMQLQRINDRIPKYLPDKISVAHKTGLERGICHDAGIVFTPKGNFLICVLTRHKNHNSRPSKELIARLARYTYAYFEQL